MPCSSRGQGAPLPCACGGAPTSPDLAQFKQLKREAEARALSPHAPLSLDHRAALMARGTPQWKVSAMTSETAQPPSQADALVGPNTWRQSPPTPSSGKVDSTRSFSRSPPPCLKLKYECCDCGGGALGVGSGGVDSNGMIDAHLSGHGIGVGLPGFVSPVQIGADLAQFMLDDVVIKVWGRDLEVTVLGNDATTYTANRFLNLEIDPSSGYKANHFTGIIGDLTTYGVDHVQSMLQSQAYTVESGCLFETTVAATSDQFTHAVSLC